MAVLDNKSPINVSHLTMWTMTSDDNTGTKYEAYAHEFLNQLNSFAYTPTVNTATQYGDGVKVEDVYARDGGTCNCTVRAFSADDEAFLFGAGQYSGKIEYNKYVNGEKQTVSEYVDTVVSSRDDVIPYVCVAFETKRSDGLINLYKFPKVKWAPTGETLNQAQGSQIQFGTAALNGTYSPTIALGNDMYRVTGLKLEGTQAYKFYNAWFADASVTSVSDVDMTDGGE